MASTPVWSGSRESWQTAFAHHPESPAYAQDVYPLGSLRLCVGCFTTFPVFVALSFALALAPALVPWWAWTGGGLAVAAIQGISSAGLARRRWQKIVVKASLGAGLAAAVYGILEAPIPPLAKSAAFAALLGLAYLSALPRQRRMAAACAARNPR